MAVVILSTVVFILSTMPEVFPNTQTLILLHIYQYSHTILTILNTLNNAWGLNISTTIQRQRFHVSFLFQVVSITISPISSTSMLIHQHQHLARMWYHHNLHESHKSSQVKQTYCDLHHHHHKHQCLLQPPQQHVQLTDDVDLLLFTNRSNSSNLLGLAAAVEPVERWEQVRLVWREYFCNILEYRNAGICIHAILKHFQSI